MKNNQLKCPHCKSDKIVKRGAFETKAHGKQQRYFCKSCLKKFIIRSAFYRMRNTPQKITLCLDLFFKGVSTRQIQSHLQAFYPHNSSNVSIYKWVIKYSNLIHNYTNNLKVENSHSIEMDEMEYHRRKHPRKKYGVSKNWFIDIIDLETRYLLSSDYASSRNPKDIYEVLKKAKEKSNNDIARISTDGLGAYSRCIRKVWHYYKRPKHYTIKSSSSKFNWKIERLHNSVRQLTQNFRGFHGSLDSARSIMKGYEVYYNFIRKHQGINCTPSELATDVKLTTPNKWLELIQLSNSNK